VTGEGGFFMKSEPNITVPVFHRLCCKFRKRGAFWWPAHVEMQVSG